MNKGVSIYKHVLFLEDKVNVVLSCNLSTYGFKFYL